MDEAKGAELRALRDEAWSRGMSINQLEAERRGKPRQPELAVHHGGRSHEEPPPVPGRRIPLEEAANRAHKLNDLLQIAELRGEAVVNIDQLAALAGVVQPLEEMTPAELGNFVLKAAQLMQERAFELMQKRNEAEAAP